MGSVSHDKTCQHSAMKHSAMKHSRQNERFWFAMYGYDDGPDPYFAGYQWVPLSGLGFGSRGGGGSNRFPWAVLVGLDSIY